MPFLHPTQLERLREFWKVNPWPPGIYIETGRIWPDFLGHGGGSPSFFVTERVLESMRTEGLTITRATEIPIGQIDSKALKDKPPPRYFVVETAPGIEVDFAATGIPTDAEGKPVLNPLPKPWPPVAWRLRLSSWNGADLFCYSNFGGSLTLVCTEKVVELAKRYYEQNDDSILPRSIATKAAFENAMTLDIAMGGSTNTVLHLLAAAHEAEVDFTMDDIDNLSRKVPVLSKVAPAKSDVHMEDVHRAGGIMAILGELDRANLLNTSCSTVHEPTLKDALDKWDIIRTEDADVYEFYRSSPGGVPTQVAFSQNRYYSTLDGDREKGVIRNAEHAFSKDGGLAVLYGNIALDGCIVKTAGVDDSILKFTGTARVFESQDSAVEAILDHKIVAGDIVVIRYEGPRGGPGMQEMLYPTSYLKSKGLGKDCALITDGRFSGGSSGLSIGHVSPEAAEGGAIGLVEDGDTIQIDIPNRTIHLDVDDATMAHRRTAQEAKGWHPAEERKRKVSKSLKIYAMHSTSAAKGAVRVL